MEGWSERVMGQKGFFDVERRLEAISAKGDPLETIKKIVPWEDFRADIEAVTETKPEQRKSNAGRKPYDTILKFKIVVLQSLHNLSDERTEYLIRDRLSFMRFLDLELEDPVPDATTIWLFREALAQAGVIDRLFERFGQHLAAGARPCRACLRPAAELDGRQDRAHHRHRAGAVQDRDDEPRLQHPPAGPARADGSCARLSALTGGVCVASCKGSRSRRPRVKRPPDRGLIPARARQPLAQSRQELPKAGIVRGALM
jgi:hypothetical protein